MKEAKLIIAILTSDDALRDKAVSLCVEEFGETDFIGLPHPFNFTKYYEPEMGPDLRRSIISFEKNISAEKIVDIKLLTSEMENSFRIDGKRKVNIDPGYLDHNKVILATAKGGKHTIYLGNGIYADHLLWYGKGWQPLPWTYPDFKNGTYDNDLNEIRKRFKETS